MAAASLQLISVFQEPQAQTPSPPPSANAPLLNPNQAQGAAVPEDTVTLTGQAGQGQQAGQDPQQQTQFQEPVITFAAQVPPANTDPAPQQPPAPQLAPLAATGAPITTTTAPNTVEQNPPAAAAANPAANSAGPQTPQQQLQQLDQTLQQLGISPNSISLFNRMALLLYANDPAALEAFVQQLQQQVTQPSGQSAAAGNAAANPQGGAPQQAGQPAVIGAAANNPAVAEAQQQVQPSAAAQQQTQNSAAANPAVPAFPTLNQNTGTSQASGSGANQTPGIGSTANGTSVFVQFEELQVAFAANGQDQAPAQGSPSVSGPAPQRNRLILGPFEYFLPAKKDTCEASKLLCVYHSHLRETLAYLCKQL